MGQQGGKNTFSTSVRESLSGFVSGSSKLSVFTGSFAVMMLIKPLEVSQVDSGVFPEKSQSIS
jgi:hypothetical protein